MSDEVIESLRRAVAAAPDDLALRLHLGRMLLDRGDASDAVAEAARVLAADPTHQDARALLTAALAAAPGHAPAEDGGDAFDFGAAEHEFRDVVRPRFVVHDGRPTEVEAGLADLVEPPALTLADVGGMEAVKERLRASFLAPLQNPQLMRLYRKRLRGGLLLYGPPGCGKTFIARALAGELGASFLSIGISDVLGEYTGQSERNLHELFQVARRAAPCVCFIDELDALGQRRSQLRSSGVRVVVNQLLTELDGVEADNDGVFVLAATNQPWDVDPALRRPGRFDRTVLVLPPDAAARATIFEHHLADRPIEGIDTGELARLTDGFSGADIALVCESASERALLDSLRSGQPRLIGMADLVDAVRATRPSTTAWLNSVRTLAELGEDDGTLAELRAYLKRGHRL